MDNQRIDGLERFYVENYSLYREFSDRMQNLIQNLIERDDIEIYKIEAKIKSPEELLKATSGRISSPAFNSISDFVIVRVLLRFPEDVGKVEQIISEEFTIDSSRSIPASTLDDPFRFGYPAAYYTLSLSGKRYALREWRKYESLLFQLDIRTMLQEVWAAVLPKVNVNVDTGVRKKMERKLVRIASLLEEADEGFLSLYETSKNAFPVAVAEDDIFGRTGTLEPIIEAPRVYSIEELYDWFAQRPEILENWGNAAVKAGFPLFIPSPDYLRGSFENLYTIFKTADIDTLDEVVKFMQSLDEYDMGVNQLQEIYDAFEKNVRIWRVDGYSVLFLLVLNIKWDTLKDRDLVALGIKKASDRISGLTD
ncbi:MAG: RelA/SpoT domain-containing protein [Synergistaceae bacterium]|nr:RelA/SpoT domain-containing protein [Synergistaceae bacterium]